MSNADHRAGGGNVKIKSRRSDWTGVTSRCGTFDNVKHQAGGGQVKIENQKLDFSTVKSKCGTFDNVNHQAGGGKVEIFNEKLPWKETGSRNESLASGTIETVSSISSIGMNEVASH